jgi:hypothetical protein
MSKHTYLNFKQAVALIKAVGHKRTVVLMGENGIGKTSVFWALASDPHFDNYIKVPPIDCTQLSDGSVWGPDIDRERGVYCEYPNERLGLSKTNHKGIAGARPILGMFDEIAKVPQYIKNMIAPIQYERRAGILEMPEGSVWLAGTNLSIEGLGDSLPANLRSKMIVVHMRKPNASEWINEFAIPRGLHPTVIACVEENPMVMDSFIDYLPGGKYHGRDIEKDNPHIFNPQIVQDAYASPRTLHAASDVMYASDEIDSDTLDHALAGTVGASFASVLSSYIRFGKQLPSLSTILSSPLTAPLPTNKIAQQVQVFQFITRAETRDDAAAFVQYVKRMQPEMQSLFCRRVADSERVNIFKTVTEFGLMLADNRIFYRA